MIGARYRVEIVRPDDGRVTLWAMHETRDAAEAEAAKLRGHKMFAQVRRVDDDGEHVEQPEHNGERRRFLCWALMLGAIPPERLTERIVAEIEGEASS